MNNNNIKILYLLICLLILKIGKSCINEYRTLLDGSVVFTDNISFVPQGRFDVVRDKDYLIERLNDAKAKYETTKNLEDFSDLGAMYVYNGEYLKAKAIFQAIEKSLPNLYQTAANLGTTYELLG
ncbi:MAG: hypothetical protein H6553_14085 [Chitinophagales bacterium]|nr:hypothetical protein [Chitinophagales bacterium]